ncbi:MAG: glycosyltransferase [Burkholderiales bacterium]|nr:glycosyltransferase [Burkholderiales bacterium]
MNPAGARVLVYSSLFPSDAAPNAGLFIRERMFRVAAHLPLAVVAPQPWSPFDALIRRFRPGFRPPAERFERMAGIDVHRPRFLSLPGLLKSLDGWLMACGTEATVRRVAGTLGATVIDAHFGYPDGYAATRIGARLGLPVVISLRGSKDRSLLGSSREAPLREALANAAQLIAVSDSLIREVGQLLGQPPERFERVGNGVDLTRFHRVDRHEARARLGLAPEARVLIGVGNLIPLKGFQRVIPLLARLRQRFPDLVYLIVGGGASQGDLGAELARLAAEHGVSDAVRLCGRQTPDELRWYYGAADAFVLATEYEGWANVLLEAMACGLPVVTTRVGGNPEVVSDPALGILVPFWDEAAFLGAVIRTLEQDWDREAIARHAQANAWDRRVDQLIGIFERIGAPSAIQNGKGSG